MIHSTSHRAHLAGRARLARRPSEIDAATRIISETANDLRSPLTSVRESIRLVHDGELGKITSQQQTYLATAINQCNSIEQMVDAMLQLDRLHSSLPRVHRSWIPVIEIRRLVDETLRPYTLPREIHVVWDGADDPSLTVFADPLALRRLIVNLVNNAIVATGDGESVLVDVRRVRGGNGVRWTVIDRGAGIGKSEMQQITASQVSTSGGEGLGLMICRKIAALHFSPLSIYSRLGNGTAVSFETATGGPSSVAASWLHWRVRQSDSDRPRPEFKATLIEQGSSRIRPARGARLDSAPKSIAITCDRDVPQCQNEISVGTVTLGAAMPKQAADQFDRFLQNRLRMFDLAYRVDTRCWVWAFDANHDSIAKRIDALTRAAGKQIASARLHWSEPRILPLDQRRTVAMLSDLLIRESLTASSSLNRWDTNEVRMGSAAIEPSDVAERRLETELRRLGGGGLKDRSAITR